MSFDIGINVLEVEGQLPPSIQPAETSVTGFLIRSKRGIPGHVVPVTSWANFVERFGGHMADAVGAYAISGFFANGGTTAYVTRLVPAGDDEPDDSGAARSKPARSASHAFATSEGTITISAGYRGVEDPGSWGNDVAVRFSPSESGEGVDLAVRYPGPDGRDVELFENLDFSTPASRDDVIDRVNGSSRYVLLAEASGVPSPTVGFVPLDTDSTERDGEFGPDELPQRATEALALFEVVEVQLLTCPETTDTRFVEAALMHCEELGDRMFVGHAPVDERGAIVRTYASSLRADKRYGAIYGPNVLVMDPLGSRLRPIPPTGHVLGIYARTDRERGIWKAPAGDAARLRGVLDVSERMNDADHTRLVKHGSINLVRPIVGKGMVVDSARTLSRNTKWLYVNVRLLFNFVKATLKRELRWVVGEPNDPNLWGRVEYDALRPFLLGLWRAGAFGPGGADDVFTVKVDADNNSPEEIAQGRLNIDVTFYPSRPAETIVVRVGQQMGASTASEA